MLVAMVGMAKVFCLCWAPLLYIIIQTAYVHVTVAVIPFLIIVLMLGL